MDSAEPIVDPSRAQLARGKEIWRRLELVTGKAPERLTWRSVMSAVEIAQKRTTGRHAGWITIDECLPGAEAMVSFMSSQSGYPVGTTADIRDMFDQCSSVGLLDTKDCETDGRFQQYVKTSSGYQDYNAYIKSKPVGAQDGSAARWWTKDSEGDYHPHGPSSAYREQFKTVIERLYNGMRVKERLQWPEDVEEDRLYSIVPFMTILEDLAKRNKTVNVKKSGRKNRGQSGVNVDQVFARIDEMALMIGHSAPLRHKVDKTATDALRAGFVKVVPGSSASSSPRYTATDDYYDVLLLNAASEGFVSLLMAAREDGRFDDLFEEADAKDREEEKMQVRD